jgi:hypothetical protein
MRRRAKPQAITGCSKVWNAPINPGGPEITHICHAHDATTCWCPCGAAKAHCPPDCPKHVYLHPDEMCPAELPLPGVGSDPVCARCRQIKTARGGDVHCSGDCDDAFHDEEGGCHEFVPPA